MADSRVIEQIKKRISLAEVIGHRVALTNKAVGEYSGLCPFHKEKSPSFSVSDNKHFYHCFGCSESGDVFSFLMKMEGLTFFEALQFCAKEVGIELPKENIISANQRSEEKAKDEVIYGALELAVQYYQSQLLSNEGLKARNYLADRGFNQKFCTERQIGYAKDEWHGLINFLQSKNVNRKTMIDAGLVLVNNKDQIYDRFRGRVMFPIADLSGRVVAFGARIIGEGEPKYLNSPETELFKKGLLLYNYHLAKKASHQNQEVIVTEGYIDALSLCKAGITNVVASLGTAITKDQLQLLWKLSPRPIICLDGDMAGIKAMERVAHVAMPLLKPGYTLMFAKLPEKQDPDDIIRKHGAEEMLNILRKSIALSEMLWQYEISKQNNSIPEHRASLEKRLNTMVIEIEDKGVAYHYKNFFKSKLWQIGKTTSSTKTNLNKSYKVKYNKNNDNNKSQYQASNLSFVESAKDNYADVSTKEGCELLLSATIFYNIAELKHTDIYEEWINIEFSSIELDKIRCFVLKMVDLHDEISTSDLELALKEGEVLKFMEYFKSLKDKGIIALNKALDHGSTKSDLVYNTCKYILDKYYLSSLKGEYQSNLQEMTDESLARASSLSKEIEELERKINIVELSF